MHIPYLHPNEINAPPQCGEKVKGRENGNRHLTYYRTFAISTQYAFKFIYNYFKHSRIIKL
jgi:hypothetical protein